MTLARVSTFERSLTRRWLTRDKQLHASTRIRVDGEPTQVRFLDREMVYVDPCSAAVLGQENKYGGIFGFPERLHRFKFIEGEAGALLGGHGKGVRREWRERYAPDRHLISWQNGE